MFNKGTQLPKLLKRGAEPLPLYTTVPPTRSWETDYNGLNILLKWSKLELRKGL
jgi:hypothetical protein